MDIPNSLNEWSMPVIEEFIQKGYYETEYFDFKEMLPNAKNDLDKQRLIKSCCAFANHEGGFLIFGISDDRTLPFEQRLVGVNSSIDFPEKFGYYPQKCKPFVKWDFRNPPIPLQNGNVIHIVHIMRSWNLPHCFETEHSNLCFPKRTNKGNELMSYEEIKMNFLQFYEKRLKLGLLKAELGSIIVIAQNMSISPDKMIHEFTLHTFSLNIIESIMADTYPLFADDVTLYSALSGLRANCTTVNNKIMQFNFVASRDLDNISQAEVYLYHNVAITKLCEKIITLAASAIQKIDIYTQQ
jgi:hypothetical protein